MKNQQKARKSNFLPVAVALGLITYILVANHFAPKTQQAQIAANKIWSPSTDASQNEAALQSSSSQEKTSVSTPWPWWQNKKQVISHDFLPEEKPVIKVASNLQHEEAVLCQVGAYGCYPTSYSGQDGTVSEIAFCLSDPDGPGGDPAFILSCQCPNAEDGGLGTWLPKGTEAVKGCGSYAKLKAFQLGGG